MAQSPVAQRPHSLGPIQLQSSPPPHVSRPQLYHEPIADTHKPSNAPAQDDCTRSIAAREGGRHACSPMSPASACVRMAPPAMMARARLRLPRAVETASLDLLKMTLPTADAQTLPMATCDGIGP